MVRIARLPDLPASPAATDPVRGVVVRTLAQTLHGAAWTLGLLHDRPTLRLIWITRGQGVAVLAGRRRGIGAHNVLLVPPGALFALETGPQTLGHVIEASGAAGAAFPAAPLHLRLRDGAAQTGLTAEIDALSREAAAGLPHAAEAMTAHLQLIAVRLWRESAREAGVAVRESAADRLARRYAEAVSDRFRGPRRMSDLAAELGVSPTHLNRVCRAASGRSAAALLSERRLHEARERIETTADAFGAIAAELGFGSAAHFSRFLRARTGRSPSVLRREAAAARR